MTTGIYDFEEARVARNVTPPDTETCNRILGALTPPLTHDDIPVAELMDYFSVSRSAIGQITRRNIDKMTEAGYRPGSPGKDCNRSLYSRRAVVQLALYMQARRNPRVRAIHEALGVGLPEARPKRSYRLGVSNGHVLRCQKLLEQAAEAACDIRDIDPLELWERFGKLDRYDLQTLAMTLAAIVSVDHPNPTGWLAGMLPEQWDGARSPSHGLALLIPPRAPRAKVAV